MEYLFPYAYPAAELKARLDDHGLRQVLFNAAPGDWDKGERGLASLPGREAEFRRAIAQAIDYAQVLGNRHIHVMAGLLPAGADRIRHRETYLDNLAHAAREAAGARLTVLIEPINNRDMPGFFLTRQDDAQAICREVGADNLRCSSTATTARSSRATWPPPCVATSAISAMSRSPGYPTATSRMTTTK